MPQDSERAEAARAALDQAQERCSGLARIPALLARIGEILHAGVVLGDYWMSRLLQLLEDRMEDKYKE